MHEFFGGWILPLVYTVGYLLVLLQPKQHWQIARATGLLGLIGTLGAIVGVALCSPLIEFDIDKLGLLAALLVSLLGWVIINFSSRYLNGDRNQSRFIRAMLFTLASVGLLLLSRHLLVIALAWTGSSIGLHFLLTHYHERKAAQIVAHKKFLVSRLAELCLFVALLLVYNTTATLQLDELGDYLAGVEVLPGTLHIAALLIALAAILKSAQLPLHGWLIQVMEAPTPVSALLHAGIVNIGGFVLIRMAELISLAPAAQILLVVVGSITAVLASLVMITRISVKVRLAWSTCAQMGFMLLEVGLGLYELALLHLIAHSLYKAHAFLSAGDSVEIARRSDFFKANGVSASPLRYIGAALLGCLLLAASLLVWQEFIPTLTLPVATLVIVGLGLASLLWFEQGIRPAIVIRGVALVLGLSQLYLVWHLVFASFVPAAETASTPLTIWVVLCFSSLYATQAWLRSHPQGTLARTLYPWAYCGFYLDETFTRLTFKIWPARLSPAQAQTLVHRPHLQHGDLS